ncbi:MAG: hypothetical protein JOS17DRAFT_377285 [Linnemannia elongata]|nr:MAG: hypothetical protein JOS17DRAFT_377285 [Linnemannia elongata]
MGSGSISNLIAYSPACLSASLLPVWILLCANLPSQWCCVHSYSPSSSPFFFSPAILLLLQPFLLLLLALHPLLPFLPSSYIPAYSTPICTGTAVLAS